MKLHLSTGGERCVNPLENLNSFMPLALPSWTYPRLRFSSMLPEETRNRRKRVQRDERFGGSNESSSNPWYANGRVVCHRSFCHRRGMLRSRALDRSLHDNIYSLALRTPSSFLTLERMLWHLQHWFLRAPSFRGAYCPVLEIRCLMPAMFDVNRQRQSPRRVRLWSLLFFRDAKFHKLEWREITLCLV